MCTPKISGNATNATAAGRQMILVPKGLQLALNASCNTLVHDYARHIHFIQATKKSVGAHTPSAEVCNDTVGSPT